MFTPTSQLITVSELVHILAQLEPSKYCDTNVNTIVSCLRASRVFNEIAKTDLLWVEHYRARYTRMWMDGGAAGEKRGACVPELVELGDGAWDALRIEATCRVPPEVKDGWAQEERERWEGIGKEWSIEGGGGEEDSPEEQDGRIMTDDWIQRQWWAKQALGMMAQTAAVRSMAQLLLGEQPAPGTRENAKAFEEGLKALSGLMGVNVAEISRDYDNLTEGCARHLQSIGICVDPYSSEFDLKAFSAGVCSWVASQGFKKAMTGSIITW